MSDSFDLSGRVALSVEEDVGDAARRAIAAQLDPFAARSPGRPADVVVRAAEGDDGDEREVLNPAGDGLATAHGKDGVRLLAGGCWARMPTAEAGLPLEFVLGDGFVPDRAFGALLRCGLQHALALRGFVAVHAAAVELDGGAVVVAGWSESGKTETALGLIERGATFLSDKWTILGPDGAASAFPIGVGIRRWVIPFLPQLRRSLPQSSRLQFGAAAIAAGATAPMRRTRGRGALGAAAEALGRAVSLADRAALTPSGLRAAYGQEDDPARLVPLRAVVLLSNHAAPAVAQRPAEPASTAARLAQSAAYERRIWHALEDRARYAAPRAGGASAAAEMMARERDLLQPWLAATQLVAVRAPFPVDPRRVVDVVLRALAA